MLFHCSICGASVSFEGVNIDGGVVRCSDCVRAGKTIQWPAVWVKSEPFGKHAVPERLRHMAIAYLKSAQTLCRDLGEHPEHLDWPRACVPYFCVYHAVEVFLKACILLRAPGDKLHHNVSKLQHRYCELYPEIREGFHLETPWDIGLENMGIDIEDYEHHTDQVLGT
jgi:hypothetical protein